VTASADEMQAYCIDFLVKPTKYRTETLLITSDNKADVGMCCLACGIAMSVIL
jgi:hypothetical protein